MSAQAKARLVALAAEAKSVVDSTSLDIGQKKVRLDGIEAEVRSAQAEISARDFAGRVMGGGESGFGPSGLGESGMDGWSPGAHESYGGPSMRLSGEQANALHIAAKSKQSLKIETKAALDLTGDIPAQLSPGIIAFRREPTRVASLFPNAPMGGPSIEYLRHASSTGAAATVAPGAAKPEITLNVDTVTATARKIAGHIGVNDESLLDFHATNQYLSSELARALTSAENTQLLSGNGTAPNIDGVLVTSGLLTRTQAASPETPIDTLELALNDLRVGASFAEATGFVANPTDWAAIRLLKNSYGEYLLGHPAEGDAAMMWGKPVILTTDCPAKTVLVGAFDIGGAVLFRQGVTIETQSTGSDWTSNITRFRAEERLALAIYRPSAFVKVTLL